MKHGDVLRTRWLVRGVPRHIPGGSAVTVREVHYYTRTGKPTKNPKSAARTRIGVEYMGNMYWLDPEQIEGAAENPTRCPYQLELANKVRNGRAVGNEYVITQRAIGRNGIVERFDTREEAEAWLREHCPDRDNPAWAKVFG